MITIVNDLEKVAARELQHVTAETAEYAEKITGERLRVTGEDREDQKMTGTGYRTGRPQYRKIVKMNRRRSRRSRRSS